MFSFSIYLTLTYAFIIHIKTIKELIIIIISTFKIFMKLLFRKNIIS